MHFMILHTIMYMQAYKQKKVYIIAEGPMSSTVRNMWKVICDRKCGAVIMLSDLIENGMVRTCTYYVRSHIYSVYYNS